MEPSWTAAHLRRVAEQYERACRIRDPLGSQYVHDLDEARGWDLDPDALLDGTEDAAELAADTINSVGDGGWGERGVTARDAWLALAAAERAIAAAALPHSGVER